MPSLASAQSSSMLSLQRFVADMTPLQIRQHRDAFEVALRALDAYCTSPKAQGMHAEALRYWNYQRSTFAEHAQQLTQILASAPTVSTAPKAMPAMNDDDGTLSGIKVLIAGKSPSEVLVIRDEIAQQALGLSQALGSRAISIQSAGQERVLAEQDRLQRHVRELAYLNSIVG